MSVCRLSHFIDSSERERDTHKKHNAKKKHPTPPPPAPAPDKKTPLYPIAVYTAIHTCQIYTHKEHDATIKYYNRATTVVLVVIKINTIFFRRNVIVHTASSPAPVSPPAVAGATVPTALGGCTRCARKTVSPAEK